MWVLAVKDLIKNSVNPSLVLLAGGGVPAVEAVELDRANISLASFKDRVIGVANFAEWVKRPTTSVTDETQDTREVVRENN